jgi:predicted RNase H-like nuclease (RuvC/YqgF family)
MNTKDLKKNSKEELIIYIEKMSRDMTRLQEENLELRRNSQYQEDYIMKLERDIERLNSDICGYMDMLRQRN